MKSRVHGRSGKRYNVDIRQSVPPFLSSVAALNRATHKRGRYLLPLAARLARLMLANVAGCVKNTCSVSAHQAKAENFSFIVHPRWIRVSCWRTDELREQREGDAFFRKMHPTPIQKGAELRLTQYERIGDE